MLLLDQHPFNSATDFVQGVNSWMSQQGGKQSVELSSFYCGMAPPDAVHTYELHVFALDAKLDLSKGFMMNDLYKNKDGKSMLKMVKWQEQQVLLCDLKV